MNNDEYKAGYYDAYVMELSKDERRFTENDGHNFYSVGYRDGEKAYMLSFT